MKEHIRVEVDPARLRPIDADLQVPNIKVSHLAIKRLCIIEPPESVLYNSFRLCRGASKGGYYSGNLQTDPQEAVGWHELAADRSSTAHLQ